MSVAESRFVNALTADDVDRAKGHLRERGLEAEAHRLPLREPSALPALEQRTQHIGTVLGSRVGRNLTQARPSQRQPNEHENENENENERKNENENENENERKNE